MTVVRRVSAAVLAVTLLASCSRSGEGPLGADRSGGGPASSASAAGGLGAGGTEPEEPIILTEDEVLDALAAAPAPPVVDGLRLDGVEASPTGFTGRLGLVLDDGAYEVEVGTVGPMATAGPTVSGRLEVSDAQVEMGEVESNGGLGLAVTAAEAEGSGRRAAVTVTGLDVVTSVSIEARIRRADDGSPRPWETDLGCGPDRTSVRWKVADDPTVRTLACPQPFEWVAVPAERPALHTAGSVLAAAIDAGDGSPYAKRLARLLDLIGSGVGPESGLTVQVAVRASVPLTGQVDGPSALVPLVLLRVDAAEAAGKVGAAVDDAIRHLGLVRPTIEVDVHLFDGGPSWLLQVIDVTLPPAAA